MTLLITTKYNQYQLFLLYRKNNFFIPDLLRKHLQRHHLDFVLLCVWNVNGIIHQIIDLNSFQFLNDLSADWAASSFVRWISVASIKALKSSVWDYIRDIYLVIYTWNPLSCISKSPAVPPSPYYQLLLWDDQAEPWTFSLCPLDLWRFDSWDRQHPGRPPHCCQPGRSPVAQGDPGWRGHDGAPHQPRTGGSITRSGRALIHYLFFCVSSFVFFSLWRAKGRRWCSTPSIPLRSTASLPSA